MCKQKYTQANLIQQLINETQSKRKELREWLDIHYEGNIYYKDNHCPGQVLRNCVHPDLGLAVFENGL